MRIAAYATPARRRSWKCTTPTGLPPSTTISWVFFIELSSSSASLTSWSGRTVFGSAVITSSTLRSSRLALMCRRRSPSVMMPTRVGDADAAEGLGRHLGDRFRHAGADRGERDLAAGMHDVAHELEHRAKPTARVEPAEVDRGKAAALQQRDGERVAERGLHQRRGGGSEIVRAGLARLRHR